MAKSVYNKNANVDFTKQINSFGFKQEQQELI